MTGGTSKMFQQFNSKPGKSVKVRGMTPQYGYFVKNFGEQLRRERGAEAFAPFSVFAKTCSDKWKAMSDLEKQPFRELAKLDKKRYDMDLIHYRKKYGHDYRVKRRYTEPGAPVRWLSSYFWFCFDNRPIAKQQFPPRTPEIEIAQELGRMWSRADPETKSKYKFMSDRDKERYFKALAEYKEKRKNKIN